MSIVIISVIIIECCDVIMKYRSNLLDSVVLCMPRLIWTENSCFVL